MTILWKLEVVYNEGELGSLEYICWEVCCEIDAMHTIDQQLDPVLPVMFYLF